MKPLIIGLLIAITLTASVGCAEVGRPKITARPGTQAHMELTKPSITKWTYQLTTARWVYLAQSITKEGEVYIIHGGYYVYMVDKWVHRDGGRRLDPKDYGYITVTMAPEVEIR